MNQIIMGNQQIKNKQHTNIPIKKIFLAHKLVGTDDQHYLKQQLTPIKKKLHNKSLMQNQANQITTITGTLIRFNQLTPKQQSQQYLPPISSQENKQSNKSFRFGSSQKQKRRRLRGNSMTRQVSEQLIKRSKALSYRSDLHKVNDNFSKAGQHRQRDRLIEYAGWYKRNQIIQQTNRRKIRL